MKAGFFYPSLILIMGVVFLTNGARAQQPTVLPDQPQPAHQSSQLPGMQPAQPSQQEQEVIPPPEELYPPTAMGTGIDSTMLQGEWETGCVESVPDKWIVPSQFPPNPGNGQRAVYTFDYNRIVYQVNEYRDPFCDANDIVATSHAEIGTWMNARPLPHYPATSEIDFYFKYCTGVGCLPYDPGKGLYSSKTQAVQFRTANELILGDLDPSTGEVLWHYRNRLYRPGAVPENSR